MIQVWLSKQPKISRSLYSLRVKKNNTANAILSEVSLSISRNYLLDKICIYFIQPDIGTTLSTSIGLDNYLNSLIICMLWSVKTSANPRRHTIFAMLQIQNFVVLLFQRHFFHSKHHPQYILYLRIFGKR